ncbi:MAG: hypothetical protein ACI4WY_07860 [Anaerovoracaceae bacterium]
MAVYAQCFTKDHEQETMFEGRPLSKENVETLLGILKKYGTVDFAERYIAPEELEAFFYRLAEEKEAL